NTRFYVCLKFLGSIISKTDKNILSVLFANKKTYRSSIRLNHHNTIKGAFRMLDFHSIKLLLGIKENHNGSN
ncbi:TPA: hypothetical protein ACHAC5_002742, partial [Enterococcus faecium]